jgi:hypothetical protein
MSVMECCTCERYADTDYEVGHWEVPHIDPTKKPLDFMCEVCDEKYLTEGGQYDPDLPEKESGINAQCAKAAFYVMDTINGRAGNPEGRSALKEILEAAIERQR